ncbi:hypothetical protein O4J56_06795 [Nocardiopsis sp. RSe5-2]|uniref:Uncharacterized protein n=1 Tax=Nocardiopsis endophytica TaxID=3018445 RepID=A0ABT4U1U1_9ACTN|nr:hypothetical protein [Nocardiopsis endophytica]MDA2810342.1 hypothetical protein [Nocardiopsis endophytica]
MMGPAEAFARLDELKAVHGHAWTLSTELTGREQRRRWIAERAGQSGAQTVRAKTVDELAEALRFHTALDLVRESHGDVWEVSCELRDEGVPRWAWAHRRTRISRPGAWNVVRAPSPEGLGERMAEAALRERPDSVV